MIFVVFKSNPTNQIVTYEYIFILPYHLTFWKNNDFFTRSTAIKQFSN